MFLRCTTAIKSFKFTQEFTLIVKQTDNLLYTHLNYAFEPIKFINSKSSISFTII